MNIKYFYLSSIIYDLHLEYNFIDFYTCEKISDIILYLRNDILWVYFSSLLVFINVLIVYLYSVYSLIL